MDLMGSITFGIAVLGAGLGILNTWRTFDRDRVKLTVIPQHAIPFGDLGRKFPHVEFCIEVINRSAFPVIVSEVGFQHRGMTARAALMQPVTLDGKSIPRKLEAREAVSFFTERPTRHQGKRLTYAYAQTSCGRTFKGSSPALRHMND